MECLGALLSMFARAGGGEVAPGRRKTSSRRSPCTRHPGNDHAARAMIARRLATGAGCSPLGGPRNGKPATPFERGQLVSPPEGAVASCTVT